MERSVQKTCSACKEIYKQAVLCRTCHKIYKEAVMNDLKQATETTEKLRCQIEGLLNSDRKARETERELKRQIEDLENSNKKARVTEEKLKCQIEDLNSTLTFMRSSVSNTIVSPPPFSDIVLVASDDPSPLSISANRAILACRSPVFRAMLENEMEESTSGIIKIGEVSYDTLGLFVSYMYTGEAILDEKMASDLLMLGEKYQIPHLKTYCERFLSSILTWENSLPIYAFARQNNSQSLQDASLSLIIKDIQKLPKRQDYGQFVEKDPRMVLEIYEAGNDR